MSEPSSRKKKTKSDIIRVATVQEYVQAHSKPNGDGWRGFFKSNLFTALVMFLLTQSVIITGLFISNYYKTTQLAEWKGQTDSILRRMDEQGTNHSHYEGEKAGKDIAVLQIRMDKQEDKTTDLPLIKEKINNLSRDVEALRNGKK